MTAQITEIRPGVKEAGSVTHIDEQEKNWRHGVVRHVQAQIPTFKHEQSIPIAHVPPLDSQTVKRVGAVLTEAQDLGQNVTGSDVVHNVNSFFQPITGVRGWLRHMRGKFGKKLTEFRREQKENAKKNLIKQDIGEVA